MGVDRAMRILLDTARLEAPLCWRYVFGADLPVEIEIGSGKGRFLKEEAARRPHCGFLGVEYGEKWARHAVNSLSKAKISNVRIVVAETVSFFDRFVPSGTVQAVHIYFPDPWPKRRHAKRRIWQPEFVQQVLRILRDHGMICFATDIRGYFLKIQEMLSAEPTLEQRVIPKDGPMTGYSSKLLAQGRPVFAAMFVNTG